MEKEHVGLWFMCKMNNSLPWCQGLALWILATLQHPDEILDVKLLENMEALWPSWRSFHWYQNKDETCACTWIYHYVKKSRTWCCATRYTSLQIWSIATQRLPKQGCSDNAQYFLNWWWRNVLTSERSIHLSANLCSCQTLNSMAQKFGKVFKVMLLLTRHI